jgi:hypothetical protein
MKLWKRILPGLLAGLAILTIGVALWASFAARPTDPALRALESDKRVSVTMQGGYITFSPPGAAPDAGFIFYPGARVDYRAYAPVLRQIAEGGTFVAVVKVTLNLAFFEVNAADKVISEHPEISLWAVGGHSLGGVAASSYASAHPDLVSGVVLWASYPADDSLKRLNIPVLSVYGSNDGLAGSDRIELSRALLPDATLYFVIEGGNHAQFGAYGEQSGDRPASISAEEQWRQTAEVTLKFLESLQNQ